MRKFWLKTIGFVLGGVLAALALGAIIFPQPTWRGKTASAWLKEFDGNSSEASEAMRQLGTKALPVIERDLRAKDAPWKLQLVGLLKQQSVVRLQFTPDTLRRERAVRACAALGPLARPAIPALGEALGNGSGRAVQVLEKFGPEAIIALATGLTNAPACATPYGTAHALGRMGAKAKTAVTNLAWEFEHHSITPPRTASARAMADICLELIEKENQPNCAEVVFVKATLIHGLSDTNVWMRRAAADALAVFKASASEAAPALLKLVDDHDPRVRESAVKALQAIDPEVAARAEAKL